MKNILFLLTAISMLLLSSNSTNAQGAGNALNFDGVDDNVLLDNQRLDTAIQINFTVEGWIKPTLITSGQNCIWEWIITGNFATHLYYMGNAGGPSGILANSLYCNVMFDNGAKRAFCTPAGTINKEEWYHFALVRNGIDIKMYINGVDQTLVPVSFNSVGSFTATDGTKAASQVSLGARVSGGLYGHQKLDDIRLWNIARTQSEISNNMCGSLSSPYPTSLIGYWNLNTGSGDTIYDSTSNGIKGVLGDASHPQWKPTWVASGAPSGVPTASLTTLEGTSFCAGGYATLNCSANGSDVTYQWKKAGNNINGATTNPYSAKTTGSYTCLVVNACGSATSNAINATSIPNAAVTLTASGSAAFCAGDSVVINTNVPAGYSLQWYRSNISITGATGSSYVAKQPGTYKVVSKNNTNGCSRINSSSVITTVNCRMANPNQRTGLINTENSITNRINLYPNPTAGSFTFEYAGLSEDENGTAVIQLYNSTGQKVYESNLEVENGHVSKELNLTGSVKNGIYLLRMEINNQIYDSKVIIQ